eukprot:CAMPEP_0113878614 /NCGR_PEP_ID=MMETSP0780_2-20120614/6787_1 /TAXON_ID=652834 /ORGANISM="Palpitomonas bilix" /LENGTH=323 /DNA_ID=CAMNT_0000865117 /DNA_START=66 /DNA_END=1037 /DNA_ORIENTATION=- /assembly_acc=CAM_ASM_000599
MSRMGDPDVDGLLHPSLPVPRDSHHQVSGHHEDHDSPSKLGLGMGDEKLPMSFALRKTPTLSMLFALDKQRKRGVVEQMDDIERRKSQEAERKRKRRMSETPEEASERRAMEAKRKREMRAKETEAEANTRRRVNAERQRRRRMQESPEVSQARRAREAAQKRLRRAELKKERMTREGEDGAGSKGMDDVGTSSSSLLPSASSMMVSVVPPARHIDLPSPMLSLYDGNGMKPLVSGGDHHHLVRPNDNEGLPGGEHTGSHRHIQPNVGSTSARDLPLAAMPSQYDGVEGGDVDVREKLEADLYKDLEKDERGQVEEGRSDDDE